MSTAMEIAARELSWLIEASRANVKLIPGPVYNVQGYGAKGDGVSDDTHAIQIAIYEASANGGGVVYFPDGVYALTGVIKIPSNMEIVLSHNAILKRMAHINAMLMNDSSGTTGGYDANENIIIRGGVIDANKEEYPTACTSVGFGHCKNIVIDNVVFKNNHDWHMIELNAVKNGMITGCTFKDYGTPTIGTEALQLDLMAGSAQFPWFGPYDNTPCKDITIGSCVFDGGVDGIGSHSSAVDIKHANIKIKGNVFRNLRGVAVKTLNYEDVLIQGNHFESCFKGVEASTNATTCTNYKILDNTFKNIVVNADGRAIQIMTGTSRGLIKGNYVETVGRHGIGIDLCNDWIIDGNEVSGCSQAGIWSYGSDNVKIINNICVNNNVGGVPLRFDIMVGFYGLSVADYNVVSNNFVGTLGLDAANATIITGNQIITGVTETASTLTQKYSNFISGAWVS